jgi:hypothetical protein
MDWANAYLRDYEKQKQQAAFEQHYRREFAALRAEERRARRAVLAVQLLYAVPCALCVICGFGLAAWASGQRESWGNSFTILCGLALMFAGILIGIACDAAQTHATGFFQGVHRWKESIRARRAALEAELRDSPAAHSSAP